MQYEKKEYEKEFKKLLEIKQHNKFYIKESENNYKINKFKKKGIDSLKLAQYILESTEEAKNYWIISISYYAMLYLAKAAILSKGYETDDHYATQIALGHLLIPNQIEKEDLELLEQTHKILENEYINYFQEARTESRTSRYSASKTYTEKRVKEILKNANKFIRKIRILLED